MSIFKDNVVKKLAEYAEENPDLKGKMGGAHNKKGSYDYIIHTPEHDWSLNLIEPSDEMKKELESVRRNDADHLNSSQVMCFNFFYPLKKQKLLHLVLKQIDSSVEWGNPTGVFEYESQLEKNKIEELKKSIKDKQKRKLLKGVSNIDFCITTDNGYKVYFEIKYTENAFDKFGPDNKEFGKYIEKVKLMYQPLLDNSLIHEKIEDECFVKHYQVIRNLIHYNDERHYVVFLLPKQNKSVWDEAIDVKKYLHLDEHCTVLDWSELTKQIKKESGLNDYYNRFEEKYLNFL